MSDFVIKQGTDNGIYWPVWSINDPTVPFVFTGWTAIAQFRSIVNNKLLAEFTTQNGGIVLTTGQLTLLWTSTQSSLWTWTQANYGIELIGPNGDRHRFAQGIVTLSKEIVI